MSVCLLSGVDAGKKGEKCLAFINTLWIHSYHSARSVQRTTDCSTAISLFMHYLLVFTLSWVVDGSHIIIIEV